MQRTPIKVPGKRKVDKSKSAIAARKSLNRSRGRPLQLEPSTASKALEKKRIRKMAQPARERTLVERLPPEILARIFWFSMNFDMPRSSLELRNKLSDTSIYKKTVIEAFGPIWNLWYGYTDKHPPKDNQVDISETAGLVIHDRPGDHILEHNVLKCRWATVDLLIGAKELWIQRNALKRPFKPLEFLPQVGKARRVEQESRQTVAEYFAKDYGQFCEAIEDLDERALKKQCNWDKYTEIHYKTEIPDTLLKGPWDEDMTRTLFWLVRGGACIQWFGSTISEAAREGFKTAVETGNLRVLHLLDWMKAVRLHKREDEVLNAVRNACKHGGNNKLAIIKRVIHYGALEDRMTMDVKHLLDVLGLMEISNKERGNFEQHALVTAVIGELEYIQRHHRRVR